MNLHEFMNRRNALLQPAAVSRHAKSGDVEMSNAPEEMDDDEMNFSANRESSVLEVDESEYADEADDDEDQPTLVGSNTDDTDDFDDTDEPPPPLAQKLAENSQVLMVKLTNRLLVTLSLTNANLVSKRNGLSVVKLTDSSFNFYNPFKRGDVGKSSGAFREFLPKVLHYLTEMNAHNFLLLGDESTVINSLSSYAASTEGNMIGTLCDLLGADDFATEVLSGDTRLELGNLIDLNTWLTGSTSDVEQGVSSSINSSLVMQVAVQIPELYDRLDKARFVEKFIGLVSSQVSSIAGETVPLDFALVVDAQFLADKNSRQMLNDLFDSKEFEFELLSSSNMYDENGAARYDFLPSLDGDDSAQESLFTFGGDFLLIVK